MSLTLLYPGIKTDCEDNMYVTGFMASNRGFIRKYDREGNVLWTKADFQDQVRWKIRFLFNFCSRLQRLSMILGKTS